MFIARDQRKGRKNGRRLRWTNKAKRRALAVLHPTGNPYPDLCLWKGRFPSRKAQFCTEHLKRNIAVEFQLDLIEQGHTVVSGRACAATNHRIAATPKSSRKSTPTSIPSDQLSIGMRNRCLPTQALRGFGRIRSICKVWGRVGCMPCINANKAELAQIARRFPEILLEFTNGKVLWLWLPSVRLQLSFRHPGITPDQAKDHGIYQVIEWAKTTRGGKQFDLLADLNDVKACASSYGLCE